MYGVAVELVIRLEARAEHRGRRGRFVQTAGGSETGLPHIVKRLALGLLDGAVVVFCDAWYRTRRGVGRRQDCRSLPASPASSTVGWQRMAL
jgi:hypothetical protein